MVGDEEVWGEPVERCMHCFKDYPLSKIVRHSNKCKEELLGNKDRFKSFLPSVHDVNKCVRVFRAIVLLFYWSVANESYNKLAITFPFYIC